MLLKQGYVARMLKSSL